MSEPERFELGSELRVKGAFDDDVPSELDPTVVRFTALKPDGTTFFDYIYLTDSELVRDSEGRYYVDLDLDQDGKWFARFWSTGAVGKAAQEVDFVVREAKALIVP